jgi:hypothetical protein
MRRRTAIRLTLILIATIGGIATFALSVAQPPANSNDPSSIKPASYAAPAPKQPRAAAPGNDPAQLSESLRGVWHSARSGAEWLMRMDNPVNGRFQPGWMPDLNGPVAQDHYLNQAGAAYALAKAARYFGDDRYLMKARQAVLSLLADTQADSADPASRSTSLPPLVVNRTAAAGMLLMVINSLENPADDLLKQGEELCQFIRQQQQPDGSIRCHDAAVETGTDQESLQSYPGLALYGLLLSARSRPAPWKLDVVARSLPYYRNQWKSAPTIALAASFTQAFAEAYLQTRVAAYAQFVFEMSDWMCELQYTGETGHITWAGGFKTVQHGIPTPVPPTISAAANLEAMAQACLATRHVPDAGRYAKYRAATELGSQFVHGLQYTEANTLHFVPGYRPALLGGFHCSQQDGTLRLDFQQHALVAMIERLECVGDR